MNQLIARARARALTIAVGSACLLLPVLSQAQTQTITTAAGNGTQGYAGDGGAATSASLSQPYDVAVDAAGNRYIADTRNYRIRKVTPAGVISTIGGTGARGFSGDGGAATAASFASIWQLAVDGGGNVFLADFENHRIRKISAAGIISTVAGTGVAGFSGDGGAATSASFNQPRGIAVDSSGNLFINDSFNHRVRKVSSAGTVTTVAGDGVAGFGGDGGPATSARLNLPMGLTVTAGGDLYVADSDNNRIRRIDASGTISTIAGNGARATSGDGGPATAAALNNPWDVQIDGSGNAYIAETYGFRIRKVGTGGTISTFAGTGVEAFSGDGGPAGSAQISYPTGLATGAGALHISDWGNNRIRRIALFESCAAEGYSGSRLTLCRQVCEIDQTPSRLASLIRLYVTAYRSEPPCAR